MISGNYWIRWHKDGPWASVSYIQGDSIWGIGDMFPQSIAALRKNYPDMDFARIMEKTEGRSRYKARIVRILDNRTAIINRGAENDVQADGTYLIEKGEGVAVVLRVDAVYEKMTILKSVWVSQENALTVEVGMEVVSLEATEA